LHRAEHLARGGYASAPQRSEEGEANDVNKNALEKVGIGTAAFVLLFMLYKILTYFIKK